MQGQRSSITTLSENLSFDHGCTSSDTCIDSQLSWTTMQNSAENPPPDRRISSSGTNSPFLHHTGHDRQNGGWSLGESSLQSRADNRERKREHAWSFHSRTVLNTEERQPDRSNIIPLDTLDVDGHFNQTANMSSITPISHSNVQSQDLNMRSEFRDSEDDEHRAAENLDTHLPIRSSSEKMPSTGMDGQRISCKRKALEVQVGQSSRSGSSNRFEHPERSQRYAQDNTSYASMSTLAEHSLDFDDRSEQASWGLQLGNESAFSPNLFSSTGRGIGERNIRLRVNSSHQQDPIFSVPVSTESNVGNSDVSSSQHSTRLLLCDRLFNLNTYQASENGTHRSQSVLPHVPSLHRNPQSRWVGASSSRTTLEREGDAVVYEEPSLGRSIPRSISENPIFAPAIEIGSSSQQPMTWNSVAGNVASTSWAGSISGVNSSSPPAWAHRSYPHFTRRLSEIVRRSLLPSVGTDPGGQSSNLAIQSSSSGAPHQETMALSFGSGNHRHHISNLERRLGGASGIPNSIASEGRNNIASEIRRVLDLLRRGEALRIEDMMILDHSVFFGMADVFDRHRHMRMDVDNMSYEELLALEERIGNVCTGLNEETVMNLLKQQKYDNIRAKDEAADTQPCSICREEYSYGEDLGILECGHDFHRDCIKQWLMHKNLCPICKMTGLTKRN